MGLCPQFSLAFHVSAFLTKLFGWAPAAEFSYDEQIERIRQREYPMLKDTLYLDHAGTTLTPKSLVDRFAKDILTHLHGNPHSLSTSSQYTAQCVDRARSRLLHLFNADPDDFDLVFVANATAGIKLVMEAFRDQERGFWYGYHKDSHTSLVGVREVAKEHRCYTSDEMVDDWLSSLPSTDMSDSIQLFAYPAQSNMNGKRLPLDWCRRLREMSSTTSRPMFSLLDAAAYVSTQPLDLGNLDAAPDFVVMSLYKVFGFPDIGALIVRKASGSILRTRKYFGGGTVDMVSCSDGSWHARKNDSIHAHLEDGTLPINSIIAVQHSLDVHEELFGTLARISQHVTFLAQRLHDGLKRLEHANGEPTCKIYSDANSVYGNSTSQGPIIAFNIKNSEGAWVGTSEIEKLAAIRDIQLRTGGLCNPGGISSHLGLGSKEMKDNYLAGLQCGGDLDLQSNTPTGMVRVSLGASSTLRDVERFLAFVDEYFVEKLVPDLVGFQTSPEPSTLRLTVEQLSVFPIKSCAAYRVPAGTPWTIRPEGLQWDREWCLVRKGTGIALSQKQHPRMALIRPTIDIAAGVLRISAHGAENEVTVPLALEETQMSSASIFRRCDAKVCGDSIVTHTYTSAELTDFFSRAVGTPCQLARFPTGQFSVKRREIKVQPKRSGLDGEQTRCEAPSLSNSILLSNESPILCISQASLNSLNEQIRINGGKAADADTFRANIVISEKKSRAAELNRGYEDDYWRKIQIGEQIFQMLGGCRRCQMVSVDQKTAARNREPFSTLAKTRRFNNKVFFGQHACHVPTTTDEGATVGGIGHSPTIKVGDHVRVLEKIEKWTGDIAPAVARCE